MNTDLTTTKNELPVLKDLVKDIEKYEEQDKLNFLLNQPVPKTWIKHHPFIKKTVERKLKNGQVTKEKVPYPYLPIDKVEHLLRKIFKRHRIEILREGQYFNGVSVTVRVNYWNPIFNEWDFHDGIGAIHLQVKSGSSPANLNDINNGALSMAFPLAKSLAVKDACDHFGDIFGANLNRNDTLTASMDKPKTKKEEIEQKSYDRITNHIDSATELKQLHQVKDKLKDDIHKKLYDDKVEELNLLQ